MAVAASPATNATAPTTTALAASTRPRRGLADRVARIRPRRYSAVMNTRQHDQHDQPGERPTRGCRNRALRRRHRRDVAGAGHGERAARPPVADWPGVSVGQPPPLRVPRDPVRTRGP